MTVDDILTFWGKTQSDGTPGHKPLLHHLLDVAAMALQWQRANAAALAREAALLGTSPETLANTGAFLAGLHDLGKASRGFQAKRPDLWPYRALGRRRNEADRGHWRNTAILLCAEPIAGNLKALFPNLEPDDLAPIIAAVAGHHGRPPDALEFTARSDKAIRDPQLGTECLVPAHAMVEQLLALVDPRPIPSLSRHQHATRWSWRLSGLITLADWVGSDSSIFTFEPVCTPLPTYWDQSREKADHALDSKGLRPHMPARPPSYKEPPRPMQKLAMTVPLTDGPQLVIVEDATGSGKTEAAIMLAARMMEAEKGEGLYFALPTMATANAMYDRLALAYRSLFKSSVDPRDAPSLLLAHGRSKLSANFRTMERRSHMENGGDSETPASAFCSEWLRDDRRKAFFADVGAGTIDQAFLAVLPKKFLTLRQYALARRILIVDEAHCFDAYMCEELAALLEHHAMNGGSAIVLSATLSLAERRRMAVAFSTGLGVREPEDLCDNVCSTAYPLLTSIDCNGVTERTPGFDQVLRPTVTVERAANREIAVAQAATISEQGAAVLVICNAVDEAVAVHGSLLARLEDPARVHLFHARFAQCDRQKIEGEVLRRFNRDARPSDRKGHVLVATQVVEQSLDLDFDFVVSDLAPVDLLIQRAGRLWRHMDRRPQDCRPLDGARMLVVSPDSDVSSETWLEAVLGKSAYVYAHAGVMWRSAKALFDDGHITAPDSFRRLIERVYAEDDVPQVLEKRQLADEGRTRGESTLGRFNVINLNDGYGDLRSSLSGSEHIGTRLGERTVVLRLARRKEGRLAPWCSAREDGDTRAAWGLSEIQVREQFLGGASPVGEPDLHRRAKAEWPEWEREEINIAIVEQNGNVHLEDPKNRFRFVYSDRTGLQRRSLCQQG